MKKVLLGAALASALVLVLLHPLRALADLAPVASVAPSAPVASSPSAAASAPPDRPHRHRDRSTEGTSPEELVPILVPISSFGTMIFIVAVIFYARHRREVARLETARFFAEKDKEVPAGLLGPSGSPSPASDLKRGFLLVATGLGISGAALMAGLREAAGVGLIPGFVGLAYIAVWRIQRGIAGGSGEG